jgi:transposase
VCILPTPQLDDDPSALRVLTPPWSLDHPQRLDLQQRLPQDHLARQIEQAVQRLDLQPLRACYHGTGDLPYPPDLLLQAVLYETRLGRHRPCQWYKDARESEPLRWLLRGCLPSRSCWYAFRDRVGPILDVLAGQVLAQAISAGLTTATRAAQDGTLVAANASRHKMVNDTTLRQRRQQLADAIAADARGGAAATDRPAWMARQPAGRLGQQRRLEQAQVRMDQLQAYNRGKRASKRRATEKVVVSLSDPEAAVGRDKEKVYRPLYNVQVVDDLDSPFVLGYEVLAQQNDAGVLGIMLQRVEQALGHALAVLLADGAYAGGADLAAAHKAGVTVYAPSPAEEASPRQIPKREFVWLSEERTYLCPQGHRLEWERVTRQKRATPEEVALTSYRCPPAHCVGCVLQERCTPNPARGRSISRAEHEDVIEALRARMGREEGRAIYRLRSQTVELVNADWKEHRQLRRFSGRGLRRARIQVGLIVLAHNLITLLKEEKKAATKGTPAET